MRLAEGVILNLTLFPYTFLHIILLRVTPTANRNSYRVAKIVEADTQGRGAARLNPWAMKSQLLQSCQGREPLPNPPQREGVPPNRLKHSRNELPPLGEGRGGASTSSCFSTGASRTFFTANGGFFTVVTAGVMHRMTVEMAPMPRRKTCFPTGIGDIPTKAKPPAVPTAFCVYFSPVWVEQIKAHSGMPTSSGNSVGVAFPQPRVAGEARYPGYIYNKV